MQQIIISKTLKTYKDLVTLTPPLEKNGYDYNIYHINVESKAGDWFGFVLTRPLKYGERPPDTAVMETMDDNELY